MNFEEKLKQSMLDDKINIDETQFLNKLYSTQQKILIKKARIHTSLFTTVFLMIFGWILISQLDTTVFQDQYYSYEEYYEYYSEIDSSLFDLYVDELALYLLENEENIWNIMNFFYEEDYAPLTNLQKELN